MITVSGTKWLLDGTPVEGATVLFVPEDEKAGRRRDSEFSIDPGDMDTALHAIAIPDADWTPEMLAGLAPVRATSRSE